MRIIPPSDFKTMPWQNGGGVTHEILKKEQDGRLLWRLSIAEVASDGPFSLFPGLSRLLTVIEGKGLVLETPGRQFHALPLQPVAFSGDWPIGSRRIAGDVRDFNVIYDAKLVSASVEMRNGVRVMPIAGAHCFILALENSTANGQSLARHSLVAPERVANFAGMSLQVTIKER